MKTFVLRRPILRMVARELLYGPMSPQAKHIDLEGHDVVEVTFTEEQANLVMKKAVDVMNDPALPNKLGGPSYRWFIGFLGQVAFFIYAFSDFKRGYSKLQSGYKPDNHDCIFRGWNLDVKTNGKPYGDRMMIPEWQFSKQYHDVYVGCRFKTEDPYVIQIWGYATRKELENEQPEEYGYGPTRAILFKNLNPIVKLKDLKLK